MTDIHSCGILCLHHITFGLCPCRNSIKAIIAFCRQFPSTLVRSSGKLVYAIDAKSIPCCGSGMCTKCTCSIDINIEPLLNCMSLYNVFPIGINTNTCRSWKYNHEVEEYFVEDETTVTIKKADITRQKETTELDDTWTEWKPYVEYWGHEVTTDNYLHIYKNKY